MFSFGVKVMRALALSAIMTCCVSVASAESLRIGDQGSEIAEVQEQLSSMGYDVVADGDLTTSSGYVDEYIAEHPEADLSLPVGYTATNLDKAKRMAIAFADAVA